MSRKFALIIGIENYPKKSGLSKVEFARNDAEAVADYARQAGFCLMGNKPMLDKNVSYGKVIHHIKHLFHHASLNDFILIYYAGHGHFSEDGGYLIPFDFQKENDIDESSCISFDSIEKRFKNKKTRRFLFFLDTCYSGFAGKQMDIRHAASIKKNIPIKSKNGIDRQINALLYKQNSSQNTGRVIFTSSGCSQYSRSIKEFKHGLFTYYLLSALESRNGEEMINVEELILNVREEIQNYCILHDLEQTPNSYSNIQGAFLIPAYKVNRKNKEFGYSIEASVNNEKIGNGAGNKKIETTGLEIVNPQKRYILKSDFILKKLKKKPNIFIFSIFLVAQIYFLQDIILKNPDEKRLTKNSATAKKNDLQKEKNDARTPKLTNSIKNQDTPYDTSSDKGDVIFSPGHKYRVKWDEDQLIIVDESTKRILVNKKFTFKITGVEINNTGDRIYISGNDGYNNGSDITKDNYSRMGKVKNNPKGITGRVKRNIP